MMVSVMDEVVLKKAPLSLCIITLNEEKNIEKCIRSVPFASDVVVLDSGSSDQTKSLALSLGARVFDEAWRGYGLQKRRAVELALHDWVLCLDADEELSTELCQEMYHLAQSEIPSHRLNGYKMPRRSFSLGKWLYFGGWYPDFQVRLFNRTKLNWSEDALHESVRGEGIGALKSPLNHYPFENLSDQIQTNNKYSSLGAEILIQKGHRISLWQLVVKPWIKFLELYLVKRGFRDGIPGYITALGGAYSYFLKYAKAWEQQKNPLKKA